MNDERAVVIVGRGGQGTKLAVNVLAAAAAHDGLQPLHYSVYDGLIRGGNVASTLAIAPQDPGTALRSRFDAVVALHSGWLSRFYPKLVPGGTLYYDPAFVDAATLDRIDTVNQGVDFGGVAGNMVAVGVVAAGWGIPTAGALEAAIEELTPAHRRAQTVANVAAMHVGWALIERGERVR